MRSQADWVQIPEPPEAAVLLAAGISPVLAPLLARRGISDGDAARSFLEPSVDQLHDPFLLAGMAAAVDRLQQARDKEEKVGVVGDYDVDGVSGTALLVAVFKACGIGVEAILPNRLSEGYGFQLAQIQRAREADVRLIVTVDCGTTAAEAIRAAADAGMDVVVTDHHIPDPDLPSTAIQINPLQKGCDYPYPFLSGAGLAFKLACALLQKLSREVPLNALLRVACLGTIADLVPLTGENRVIAALGLRALEDTRSLGLRALIRISRIKPPYRGDDVGFRLGPRLNAAGRLRRPDEALELLLTRDAKRASALAFELEACNTERRATEKRIVEEARGLFLEREPLPEFLFAWSHEWHRGVVGIAASRIAREFHRPTVLLAAEGDEATGSGRSIEGIDLHAFLSRWESRFERFGGHSQAIGLTVQSNELRGLRDEIEAEARWPPELLIQRRRYELHLEPSAVNEQLFSELEKLHPHGQKNQRPLLRVGPLQLSEKPRIFGDGHLKARAHGDGSGTLALLGWGWEDRAHLLAGEFEVLGRLGWDGFDRCMVLELRSARPCPAPLSSAA